MQAQCVFLQLYLYHSELIQLTSSVEIQEVEVQVGIDQGHCNDHLDTMQER